MQHYKPRRMHNGALSMVHCVTKKWGWLSACLLLSCPLPDYDNEKGNWTLTSVFAESVSESLQPPEC